MSLGKTNETDQLQYQFIMNMEQECYNSSDVHSTYDTNHTTISNQLHCPKTFDGLQCWDPTPAGHMAYQPCSDLIMGWDSSRMAYKICLEDGTWYKDPITNKFTSDYASCVDYEDLKFRQMVNDVFVWGYSLSIVCLVISLFIFGFYKHLRCSRILVHINLFISLIINNIMWIIWYKYIVTNIEILQENGTMCHILYIVTQYFMVTSYYWAFCEAIHLHVSIAVVFVTNEKLMMWFYFVGWGFPIIITVTYAVFRYYEKSTSQCWIGNSDSSWTILFTPVFLSLIASCGILSNIVRVLVIKLRTGTRMMASKKAVRAACILVPLFGLHYLLIPFRPSRKAPGERVYEIVSAVLNSFQGICVATLFCFTNSEVISTIRNHIKRWREKKYAIAMTGVTGDDSYPAVDNIEDENAEEAV